MRNKELINKNVLFLILILIPIFKPVGITIIDNINKIFQVWKIASICIMSIYIFKNRKNNKYEYSIPLVIFWVIYIITSFIYKGDYVDIINNGVTSILLICFIKEEFNKEKKYILKSLKYIFMLYLTLQLYSMIKINISKNYDKFIYFLGEDNYSAFSIIPMITIVLFIQYLEKEQISIVSLFFIGILTMLYMFVKSYTASLALIILLLFILLLKFNINVLKYFSIRKTYILLIILLIMILLFNIQDLFSTILNDIEKGITLNSRTIIWNNAIELIKQKPLFGYGSLSEEKINDYYLYGATHAHNIILELLLRTGIIGTFNYLMFIDKSVKNIYKRGKTSKEVSILILGVISYLILSFMDFYPILQYQYCLYAILYCYSKSNNKYKMIEENNNEKYFSSGTTPR